MGDATGDAGAFASVGAETDRGKPLANAAVERRRLKLFESARVIPSAVTKDGRRWLVMLLRCMGTCAMGWGTVTPESLRTESVAFISWSSSTRDSKLGRLEPKSLDTSERRGWRDEGLFGSSGEGGGTEMESLVSR